MRAAELSRSAEVSRRLFLLILLVATQARAERLPVKSYTTTDGLARDQVNRIVRDSKGFLWFCTVEGLSRFDGYRFTNYGTDQGLPNRFVSDLLETRGGVYWVATYGGLCRFDLHTSLSSERNDGGFDKNNRFALLHLGDEAGAQVITALLEDRAGTIWCGTLAGLYRLDQTNDRWTSRLELLEPASSGPGVISIIEDHLGALWVSTGTGLYRRRPDGIIERYGTAEGLPVRNVTRGLLEDREGRIWIGTNIGLYQLVPEPKPYHPVVERVFTTKDGLATDSVSCLFQSSDGRLWVGNWTALSESLPATDQVVRQFRKYTSANGISDVIALGEDGDGNLWIGAGIHGALKIVRNGFVTYNVADGLKGIGIGQISTDRAGELCVFGGATGKGFIQRFDGKEFTAVELTMPRGVADPGWGWYQNMFQDERGEWWMSTGEGLVRYPKLDRVEQLTKARPKAIYTTRDGLGGNTLFRIFEDSRNDIWISTIDAGQEGLTRWERGTETFHRYSGSDGLPVSAPSAFREDPAGNLWIGFYDGGVARYRAGHFTFFTASDGVPAGLIRALYLDQAGRLWIASGEGGVARLDDPAAERPKFVIYSTASGLSSNQTTCITEDRWGRIYIGTGRGIDRLEPASGRIKHYGVADGLANNYVNVSLRDSDGSLWFGTLDGLSRLVPEADLPELPPSILISGMSVAGARQRISDLGETNVSGLRLGAAQNDLQIDFLSLSFALGEVLRYQYKLEGSDNDWGAPTDQRSIKYASLPPGRYRFLVRAITAGGTVSQPPAAVDFQILPPFWRSWWFITIASIAFALMVYSLYRYRVRRLIELERVRMRIATDLHDDIGSSLSQVSVLSEVIRHRVGSDARVAEPLSMIANLSRDLVDSMNDIVWAINPSRDHLSDLIQRMRRFASDVFTARDIEFKFRAPESHQHLRLGADVRREVFLIFKESINNMIRHSACTSAEIEFVVEEGLLEMKLRDDGRGFDPDDVDEGHGLTSMRQRARRLGGDLNISSNAGGGTTVRLRASIGGRGRLNL